MTSERFKLCKLKVQEIANGDPISFCGDFFKKTAAFLNIIFDIFERGELVDGTYDDLKEENYETSYANPDYAVKRFGKKTGRFLSFLYAECYTLPGFACERDEEEILIRIEFFIEIFCMCECFEGLGGKASDKELENALYNACYSFAYDYLEQEMIRRTGEKTDHSFDHAYRIVMESDLSDLCYLKKYGEYISDNEIISARTLNNMSEKEIRSMADIYTEGYRIGFIKTGKDISKKKVVNIVYPIGFERVVRQAVKNFEKIGLKATLTRSTISVFHKRGMGVNGYYSTCVNRQFLYDHREDEALFLNKRYINRKLVCLDKAYKKYEELSKAHGGPAWIEVFGEKEFIPVKKAAACSYSPKQTILINEYTARAAGIINRYIPGEERSFTIIAYPIPEIGDKYEKIMKETMKLNALSGELYEKIQKKIIDALDECKYVKVEGMNGNVTDMHVELCKLKDKTKETKFENCTADVNIPVGEVFTSPRLKGTKGILNVKQVYLNGLLYKDLKISFKDGMVIDYGCSNYVNQKDNAAYVKENILKHHQSLPIGEFAIGTNTTAYAMSRKYNIESKLPILIAEKMGPHFAVGDTCYSHEEDVKAYNPDGKEIVARDNEISILRKEADGITKAYFNCHTDITVPYDELGRLYGVTPDGKEVDIIRDGRFVLKGTEDLNQPL